MRLRHTLFALYMVICAAALTWPGYAHFGNRTEPFVLGLPFVFAWNVGWIALTFAALLAYHVSGRRG